MKFQAAYLGCRPNGLTTKPYVLIQLEIPIRLLQLIHVIISFLRVVSHSKNVKKNFFSFKLRIYVVLFLFFRINLPPEIQNIWKVIICTAPCPCEATMMPRASFNFSYVTLHLFSCWLFNTVMFIVFVLNMSILSVVRILMRFN